MITRYIFSASEIAAADARRFITRFDPFRLPATHLCGHFANVVIEFEGIGNDHTVPTHRTVRPLLRRLHSIWPWAGFFVRLDSPLGPPGPVNDLPLFALGLCISDFTLGLWDRDQEAYLQVGPQLEIYRATCHGVVDKLGKRAGLPASVLEARHFAINEQFQHALK